MRLFGIWVRVVFFSLVILACSLWCLGQAVFCSWLGKKVFYWCSLTLLARIFYFCKINLFFDCLVGGRKLGLFLRIFEV